MTQPKALYSENDKAAAAWLRVLIDAGLIAPGDVDERSIVDVKPDDLKGYTQVHCFAGIGGWSLALRIAGWPDDRPVWTGSCPCQPFSAAGKRKGFDDSRHLWPVFRDLIAERRPAVVFGEQVAAASDWLRLVRSDLEAMGRAVGAIPIEAASAGADHLRDRFWFVGDLASVGRGEGRPEHELRSRGPAAAVTSVLGDGSGAGGRRNARTVPRTQEEGDSERRVTRRIADEPQPASAANGPLSDSAGEQVGSAGQPRQCSDVAVTDSQGQQRQSEHGEVAGRRGGFDWVVGADGKARRVKPGVRLLAHGFPGRVGLLRGFGNAIDPRPAAAFITAYMQARGLCVTPMSDVSDDNGVFA